MQSMNYKQAMKVELSKQKMYLIQHQEERWAEDEEHLQKEEEQRSAEYFYRQQDEVHKATEHLLKKQEETCETAKHLFKQREEAVKLQSISSGSRKKLASLKNTS